MTYVYSYSYNAQFWAAKMCTSLGENQLPQSKSNYNWCHLHQVACYRYKMVFYYITDISVFHRKNHKIFRSLWRLTCPIIIISCLKLLLHQFGYFYVHSLSSQHASSLNSELVLALVLLPSTLTSSIDRTLRLGKASSLSTFHSLSIPDYRNASLCLAG